MVKRAGVCQKSVAPQANGLGRNFLGDYMVTKQRPGEDIAKFLYVLSPTKIWRITKICRILMTNPDFTSQII